MKTLASICTLINKINPIHTRSQLDTLQLIKSSQSLPSRWAHSAPPTDAELAVLKILTTSVFVYASPIKN
jgi:hypothetical protein